jgi:hypothetical protein
MQTATITRLSLRLPIEQIIPLSEAARENGSTLFAFVAQKIGAKLNLCGMSFDMPSSCQHVRLTLKLSVRDAVKLHNAARQKQLSAGDWMAYLLQQNAPAVSPSRDLSPINSLATSAPKNSKDGQ